MNCVHPGLNSETKRRTSTTYSLNHASFTVCSLGSLTLDITRRSRPATRSFPRHREVWPTTSHALLVAEATCLHYRDGFYRPAIAAIYSVRDHCVIGVVDNPLFDGIGESAADDEIMRGTKWRGRRWRTTGDEPLAATMDVLWHVADIFG